MQAFKALSKRPLLFSGNAALLQLPISSLLSPSFIRNLSLQVVIDKEVEKVNEGGPMAVDLHVDVQGPFSGDCSDLRLMIDMW